MKNRDKKELMDQLAQYGYDLSVPGALPSLPEKVLQALLKEDDMRLVEGFPVVLANAFLEKKQLEWEKKDWSPEVFSVKGRKRWTGLMAVSVSLFRLFGLEKEAQDRALKLLQKDPEGNAVLKKMEEDFTGVVGADLSSARTGASSSRRSRTEPLGLSADRLKNTFRNYVVHQAGSGKELEEQKNALEFELLLSSLFTVRQKELLQKRLARKPMTKTEREYYYRVVKKRLKALADPRLHQMAGSLV
jgi:hypothetical protein